MTDTAFSIDGAGPPVVLLHGLGLTHAVWDQQLPALTSAFRVLRYDLLGHGESVKHRGAYAMDQFVDQLDKLLDSLALEHTSIVGFSLGGMIARAYTIAHPKRVSALVILNSPHDRTNDERTAVRVRAKQAAADGPGATVDAALKRWFTDGFAESKPEVLNQVRKVILANDVEVYPEIYRLFAEDDALLVNSISAITCPTLVLTCKDDLGNSPKMARQMAARIPSAQVKILPGLRHMGLVENPDAINSIIVEFLNKAVGTRPQT